jgi:pimeloyl-ACP methyl ester carboxylesterase
MVLVHGLVALGNRHEYLNQVAEHLARIGFLVVLPNLPAETQFEMRTSDLDVLSDTVHWVALYTNQQVTLVGNSFSAGLIIPAAARPSVAGEVKLIFCNSGYYNLDTIGHYFIRDPVFDPSGKPYRGDPPTPLEIAVPYLDELLPAKDVSNVRFAIATFNENDDAELPPNNPAMLRLSPRQKQEFESLKNANTMEARNSYRGILQRHRSDIAALSPSSVLKGLRIPMYILHGEEDPIFPEGEVEWMRKDTAGYPEVHILTSPWVAHVKVGLPTTLWQKFRVIDFCEAMLQKARHKKSLPQ